MNRAPLDLRLGDTAVLKKPHPCGSLKWRVVRLGADIRLACLGCGRMIMLPRSELSRRLKTIVRDEPVPDEPVPDEPAL